jgi:hypothetical protein
LADSAWHCLSSKLIHIRQSPLQVAAITVVHWIRTYSAGKSRQTFFDTPVVFQQCLETIPVFWLHGVIYVSAKLNSCYPEPPGIRAEFNIGRNLHHLNNTGLRMSSQMIIILLREGFT